MVVSCWEQLKIFRSKEMLIEFEHVTAHRTKKERRQMSLFEKFITEGNKKADEPAKEGANAGWRICDAGRSRHGPVRKSRSACSLAVCSLAVCS